MRTTSKHPNQALILPTQEALNRLIDELSLTDYSGKKCVPLSEIKHIHLSYTQWNIINN